MSKGTQSLNTPTPEPATFEDQTISTDQEATPIPWFWGTVQVSANWITPIYGQFSQLHKTNAGGKK